MTKLLILLVAVAMASAQTMSAPVAGVVLNGDGRLLSITGVPGNLMPGLTIPGLTNGQRILTAAFSFMMGAVKTESQVVFLDPNAVFQSSREAPAGTALFGFAANGTLPWVYFPNANQLQSLTGPATLDTSGWGDFVVAIGGVNGNSIGALVSKGNQLWAETVNTDTGAISSQSPVSGAAPAVYFENGWLTVSATGLLWQSASGGGLPNEIALSSPVLTLQNAGSHSVAINSRLLLGANWQVLEIPLAPRSRPADKSEPPAEHAR